MIIDGSLISKKIKQNIKEEVQRLKTIGVVPGLAMILLGNDKASKIYISNKKMACDDTGICSYEYILPGSTAQNELVRLIEKLNADNKIHGIIVQLPLPEHIDEYAVSLSITPEKDVDVFNPVNIGNMFLGKSNLLPCTPAGVIKLLEHEKIPLAGSNCVIVGRSNIVGKPLAVLLTQKHATVTLCHSKTKNLKQFCKQADILISAVGKPKFITAEMIKSGATVIDVGINRTDAGRVCGDVDFESAKDVAKHITPVPGGVGPMTIAMLLANTVTAAKLQNKLLKLRSI